MKFKASKRELAATEERSRVRKAFKDINELHDKQAPQDLLAGTVVNLLLRIKWTKGELDRFKAAIKRGA